jgi:hypothetical protein
VHLFHFALSRPLFSTSCERAESKFRKMTSL